MVPAKAAAEPVKASAIPSAKPAADEEIATLKRQIAILTAALKALVPPAQLIEYKARLETEATEAVAKAKAARFL